MRVASFFSYRRPFQNMYPCIPHPFLPFSPTHHTATNTTTQQHNNKNDPQVVTGLMVNPPKAGDPSFPKYEEVRTTG